MATISSPGIGSGLDVRSIVAQLMAIERQPETALDQRTKQAQDQLSAYGRLSSAMSSLRDSARSLADASTWQATTVDVSKPEALSLTSDGTASPGSYSVQVSSLAAAQTLRSQSVYAASTDSVGPGTLSIQLGSWNAARTAFTAKDGSSAVNITIPANADSLAQVRDAINAAQAGVSASIITDASGSRLALRSTETGAVNGFRITVNDSDGDNGDAAGLSNLAYDGASGVSQMALSLAASNATATINGVPISSTTNAFDNVMDGLSLKLMQVTSTPVDVTINRDTEALKKKITDFADAYNGLVSMMRDQTKVGTPGSSGNASAAGGVLGKDASAKGLLNQLRSLVGGSSGADASFTRLADIGLEPQRDGSLKVNDGKLNAAIAKLDDLKTFFSRNDSDATLDGFGTRFKDFTDDRLSDQGTVGARQAALQKRIDANAAARDRLEARLALTEKRLNEQYSRLDNSVSSLNALQSYVTQQIAAWNKG